MHKRRIVLYCLFIFVFVSPIVGMLPIYLNSPTVQPIDASTIQSDYVVLYGDNITSLSHTIRSGDDVGFDQQADITGVTLQNFSLTNNHNFQVNRKFPYVLEFAMDDVRLTGDFTINGSLTISANMVNITKTFESNSYGIGYTIASPNLALDNVNASVIRLRVSGGTLSWNNSKTTALILNGFQNAIVKSSVVTGAITVAGAGNVTILDTTYGSIIESVDPVLVVEETTYTIPYNFVFQPTAKVTLRWAAYDNVQGPNFALQTNLTIYKNGVYQETISDVATNSRQITIQTAANLYEVYISCKDTQGNITTEKVTIVTIPNLLWFILMIAMIAGAAVGIVLIFYWRKQHQWQKTSLVEIPA